MSVHIGIPSDFGITTKDMCDFYNDNWSRKIALGDKKFFEWQFVNNQKNKGINECCVAVSDGGIIGIMGLNSRDFYLSGRKCDGAELTTWVVSEAHRNKGLGPAMIEYLKNKYEVMIGMGISQAALPVYLRNGFRYIKSIPRYVHVINWDNVSGHVETSPLARKYAKSQFKLTDFKNSEFNKAKADEIFETCKISKSIFSRMSGDLIWRYDENPYFKYHHYIVNDGCHVSVRIDRGIDGFVMAHCVDIFGDESCFESAISSAIVYAKSEGADAIDFFSTNATLNATLDSMGLFSTLDHDFFSFPHLFHPVEIRTPATTSLILWSRENLHDLVDISKLHITKQDADFDRPTIHGVKK
jgi:GNAT superfamily N-acetyltransferase